MGPSGQTTQAVAARFSCASWLGEAAGWTIRSARRRASRFGAAGQWMSSLECGRVWLPASAGRLRLPVVDQQFHFAETHSTRNEPRARLVSTLKSGTNLWARLYRLPTSKEMPCATRNCSEPCWPKDLNHQATVKRKVSVSRGEGRSMWHRRLSLRRSGVRGWRRAGAGRGAPRGAQATPVTSVLCRAPRGAGGRQDPPAERRRFEVGGSSSPRQQFVRPPPLLWIVNHRRDDDFTRRR